MFFGLKPDIQYGEDSLDILDTLDYKKVCIATDKLMIELGLIKILTDKLDRNNIEYHIFSDIEPDPSLNTVKTGLAQILREKPDALIALGGGSVIDAAKAIIYMCLNAKKMFLDDKDIRKPDYIVIPTTAGTGSEVTEYAVITDKVNGVKIPIMAKEMLPDLAILEPNFVKSVPKSVTASTGMDVLTHSIEAYTSLNPNPFSDSMAFKAIEIVFDDLYTTYEEPNNLMARANMQLASCMAGIAFNNSGLGITHSIAHSIGAMYHIPHGLANALVLPYVIKYNGADDLTREKYANISQMLGCQYTSTDEKFVYLLASIVTLNKKMDIPVSLSELDVDKNIFFEDLDEIVTKVMNDVCTTTNPVKTNEKDIKEILIELYQGSSMFK